MRQEAEVYADEDQQRIRIAELKNQADNLFYSYETTIRDNAGVIDDQLKAEANEKMTDLRAAIASRDITPAELQERLDALQQTLLLIGTSVYQQATADDDLEFEQEETEMIPNEAEEDQTVGISDEDDYDLDGDFDNDATIAADYEPID
jgi:molecular chaperone DnaK